MSFLSKIFGKKSSPQPMRLTEDALKAMLAKATDMGGSMPKYEYIERISGLPIHKFVDYESYLEAGALRVWAAFRACHLVASVLTRTDFRVMDTKRKTQVEGQPVNFLIANPNPYDSWEEVIYQWVYHIKLCGNAYWYKDQMNAYGQPLALYPLLPQFVQPIPDINRRVSGYRYQVNGHVIDFDADEIIHFRRPSPKDNILGMGDVQPAESLFNNFINRNIYDERFMQNGASPSGVLVKKETVDDESEWKRLKDIWDQNYSGKKNIGKTAFINGDWSYHQLGLNAQQMESIEKDKLSVEQIFMNMGIPLSIAGVREAANYATSKQDDINFRSFECVPLLDMLCSKLNAALDKRDPMGEQGVIKSFNPVFELDYDIAGLINVEQVSKDYETALKFGAITLNEFRELIGLEKAENPLLDQHFVPDMVVPIEMAGLASAPPEPVTPPVPQPAPVHAAVKPEPKPRA